MKLVLSLFLVISFQNLVLGSVCGSAKSKNCIILSLNDSFSDVSLPDLNGKTSLQIKGGNLTSFGLRLSNQLKSVQKLQLGPLGLQELYVNPDITDLTATDNQIHVVRFKTSGGAYKLQQLDLQRNRLTHLDGFEVLTNLVELHLEDNELETLDFSVFALMQNLKELHLDRNLLTMVMTTDGINLPELEYLSLAGNRLTKLNVGNWNFGSMTTWDVSSNDLIYVDGIDIVERFSSLQTVLLSRNGWHCKWLNDTMQMFEANSVNVGDADMGCLNTSGEICCASDEISVDNGWERLGNLTNDQQQIRKDLERKIKGIQMDQEDKFRELSRLLNDLQEKSNIPIMAPEESFDKVNFDALTKQAVQLKSNLEKEKNTQEEKQMTNDKLIKNLEFTILQLRKALHHEMGKISGLQKQFKLLRENTSRAK
ncbi:leucine-rich repeat transmembrane protein FLRT3-like [Armigeres subalbatus]|uniref:leucine-rich repeat transmembrane protein FLRT3-like n=1 Tax=Armigeres subalbatus TaxID=124917 RepID=UPI002ED0CF1F